MQTTSLCYERHLARIVLSIQDDLLLTVARRRRLPEDGTSTTAWRVIESVEGEHSHPLSQPFQSGLRLAGSPQMKAVDAPKRSVRAPRNLALAAMMFPVVPLPPYRADKAQCREKTIGQIFYRTSSYPKTNTKLDG